ncbi:MAG: PAS domain-containing protein [Candidatus Omnitrophota bacterium]|jgi:PAS domain-containing protein|nr:MAG: PAS domain-containing protein [Candidatus Omnitrophota bacterium]
MRTNLIKIFWLSLLVCLSLGYYLLFRMYRFSGPLYEVLLALFVLAVIFWLYIAIRVLIVRKKIVLVLKRILFNEYETGIRVSERIDDEVTHLERLINRTCEQLRVYDALRVERIDLISRAMDTVYHHIQEGIIIADLEKKNLRANPAAREIFGIEQETITFESIEKQERNRDFMEFFKNAVEREKILKEGVVTLQMPIRNASRQVALKIFPLKDKEETVKLAVIFIRNA